MPDRKIRVMIAKLAPEKWTLKRGEAPRMP
jgi:hypothetical protein